MNYIRYHLSRVCVLIILYDSYTKTHIHPLSFVYPAEVCIATRHALSRSVTASWGHIPRLITCPPYHYAWTPSMFLLRRCSLPSIESYLSPRLTWTWPVNQQANEFQDLSPLRPRREPSEKDLTLISETFCRMWHQHRRRVSGRALSQAWGPCPLGCLP